MWDGKIASVLIFAVLASALAGHIVAARYRKRVLAWMSQGTPPRDAGGAPAPPQRPARAARASSIAANRSARRRLALAIVAISLAVGFSQSWWSLQFVHNETGYGPIKLSLIGAAYAWVMVPALGLLWRWRWLRIALSSAAYMAVFGLLMSLRSTGAQSPVTMALWLGGTIAVPLIAFGLAASGRARATGPYLLPLFLILGGASVVGTDLLGQLIERPSAMQWIIGLGASHVTVFAAFALAPWLILAWPAWRLARALARGYQAKRYSEPLYLMGSYWLVALLVTALPASHGIGAASLTVLACWLWLPLGRGWRAAARPPARSTQPAGAAGIPAG